MFQVPPRPPRRERSQRRKWELWARMLSGNFVELTTSTPFRDLLHAANLRHGTDGFTSPPKEGVLRIFSPLKMRRLRPGLNPRTWVLKASKLSLDQRSRLYIYIVNKKHGSHLQAKNTTYSADQIASHFVRCLITPAQPPVRANKTTQFHNPTSHNMNTKPSQDVLHWLRVIRPVQNNTRKTAQEILSQEK